MSLPKFDLPTLVTLTAPTCGGKNFLLEALIDRLGFARIVGTTDRAPRDGEIEGLHYNFLTTDESKRMEANGEFAELVTYNGVRYGVTHAEMSKKMYLGGPPPIVILEPSGLEMYRKYCAQHNWAVFSIYVETQESIRLQRLAERTVADVVKAVESARGKSFEEAQAVARANIAKVITANNKRLQAVIEQERSWSHTNRWDVLASGTNLEEALEYITQGVKNRNSRSDIYK
jgi:guanylate kinase